MPLAASRPPTPGEDAVATIDSGILGTAASRICSWNSIARRLSRHPGARGDRRDLRRERAAEGALLRGADRAAGGRRRLGDRDRRARRARRACTRRAGTAPTIRPSSRRSTASWRRAGSTTSAGAIRRAHRARRRRSDPLRGDRHRSRGRSRREPKGTHGFGYDPIFFYPPYGCTLAEVDGAKKAAVSHRGKAFRQLRNWLEHSNLP